MADKKRKARTTDETAARADEAITDNTLSQQSDDHFKRLTEDEIYLLAARGVSARGIITYCKLTQGSGNKELHPTWYVGDYQISTANTACMLGKPPKYIRDGLVELVRKGMIKRTHPACYGNCARYRVLPPTPAEAAAQAKSIVNAELCTENGTQPIKKGTELCTENGTQHELHTENRTQTFSDEASCVPFLGELHTENGTQKEKKLEGCGFFKGAAPSKDQPSTDQPSVLPEQQDPKEIAARVKAYYRSRGSLADQPSDRAKSLEN